MVGTATSPIAYPAVELLAAKCPSFICPFEPRFRIKGSSQARSSPLQPLYRVPTGAGLHPVKHHAFLLPACHKLKAQGGDVPIDSS